jgi:hypothetical protein
MHKIYHATFLAFLWDNDHPYARKEPKNHEKLIALFVIYDNKEPDFSSRHRYSGLRANFKFSNI